MRIVPLAVKNYFVYGIPIEDTIRNSTDIFDFCLRLKTNSKSKPILRHLNEEDRIVEDILDRTTRYYVCTGGRSSLIKDFGEKESGVNVGYSVEIFNKFVEKPMADYKIDYNFYIKEAYKLVYGIKSLQLNLFD